MKITGSKSGNEGSAAAEGLGTAFNGGAAHH